MDIGWAAVLWFLTAGVMVVANTAGVHRLLTHRSYETGPAVRYALTLLSALHSGSPVLWVGVHRVHHAFADTDLDPHSSVEGFWYAHCGWIIGGLRHPVPCIAFALSGFGLQLTYLVHDLRRLAGRLQPTWRKMSRDLMKEPLMVVLDTPLVIPALFVLQLAVVFAIGGWWGVLWLWALHVVQNNASWAVNSAGHHPAFGSQTGGSPNRSRNVAWLTWLTQGDAFHNHHHQHPSSALHALDGGADASWMFICVLHRAGLARNVKLPDGRALPAWARRRG